MTVVRIGAALLGLALTSQSVFLKGAAMFPNGQPQTDKLTARDLVLPLLGKLPLMAIWLLPVTIIMAFIAGSRTGRHIVRTVLSSTLHSIVAVSTLILFAVTLLPLRPDGAAFVTYLALGSSGLLLLLFGIYPLLRPVADWLRAFARLLLDRISAPVFLALTAGILFFAANLVSLLVFNHIPHIEDSIGNVFQARIFASGRISLPAVWDDYFFSAHLICNDGVRVYSISPFFHPLLIALGALLRIEWIINPLLGALAIIVIYLLGKTTYDERTGRIAALLGVLSPFILFMSSEYMNHATAMLLTGLFLLFFLKATRPDAGTINSLLAGLSLGALINVRPLNALALAVPAVVYGIYLLAGSADRAVRHRLARTGLVIGAGACFGLLLYFGYNYLLTGSAFTSAHELYYARQYHNLNFGLGFGERGFPAHGAHAPLRGLVQTVTNLNGLNKYLFESPLPGLVLVFLLFITFTRNPADWLLLGAFLSLPIAYFFYWFQDFCFGPRFLYESLPAVLILSARGLQALPAFINRITTSAVQSANHKLDPTKNALILAVALSLLATLTVGIPQLISFYRQSYWGVDNRIPETAESMRLSNALIFVNPEFRFYGNRWETYYGAGFNANPVSLFRTNPLMSAPGVIYARDRGDENYILMNCFPGRRYFLAGQASFREITNLDSLQRLPKIQGLKQTSAYLDSALTQEYKTVLLPFRELSILFRPRPDLRIFSYTELSNDLFLGRIQLDTLLPALALYYPLDNRSYLRVFRRLSQSQSFLDGGMQFTPLYQSSDSACRLFDIRVATHRR